MESSEKRYATWFYDSISTNTLFIESNWIEIFYLREAQSDRVIDIKWMNLFYFIFVNMLPLESL